MRCPVCFGVRFETVSPERFRCLSEVVTGAVPPGLGGNLGIVPIPLYGPCGALFDERSGAQAAANAAQAAVAAEQNRQQEAQAAARRAAEQEDLKRRRVAALAALKAAGNPGLKPRRVPGRYYLSLFNRFLGRIGQDLLVDVESAWTLGVFSWVWIGSHGMENFEELETGYTSTERFVPMEYGTEGDDVEFLYRRRKLWSPIYRGSDGMYIGRVPSLTDVVAVLEHWVDTT